MQRKGVLMSSLKKCNFASPLSLMCAGLCFFALPFLIASLSAMGLGWMASERILRVVMLVSLSVFLLRSFASFLCHRHIAPILLILLGSGFLLSAIFHQVPSQIGGWTLGFLALVWVWDERLLRKEDHRKHSECAEKRAGT